MVDSTEEERLLREREYIKHREYITKTETREQHFKYKDEGYTMAIDKISSNATLYTTLMGFISKKKDCNALIDMLSTLIYENDENLEDKITEFMVLDDSSVFTAK